MKSMKEATPKEVDAIKRRALRSFAMGRIAAADCDYLVEKCDEIAARVQTMTEFDNKQKEVFE